MTGPVWSCADHCAADNPHRAVCQSRGMPCPPVEYLAGGMVCPREIPISDEIYDHQDRRHYLDVLNDIAAGVSRRRGLPPRILLPRMWRILIVHAMTAGQVPTRIIAETLNVDIRTVQRDRGMELP